MRGQRRQCGPAPGRTARLQGGRGELPLTQQWVWVASAEERIEDISPPCPGLWGRRVETRLSHPCALACEREAEMGHGLLAFCAGQRLPPTPPPALWTAPWESLGGEKQGSGMG